MRTYSRYGNPARMTKSEKDILFWIASFWTSNNYAPSLRDISELADIPFGSIRGALENLCRFEVITKHSNTPRSIVITDMGRAFLKES